MTENVISEDTPEDDEAEMLRWKIDQLVHQINVYVEENKRAWGVVKSLQNDKRKQEARIKRLHGSMTVKQLRRAGLRVIIEEKD